MDHIHNMILKTGTRVTVFVLTFVMLCTPFTGTLFVPHAQAQVTATIEAPGPLLTAVAASTHAAAATAVSTGATAGSVAATAGTTGTQLFITKVLDGIQWTIAKIAIQSITKSMVNWILSGYQGSPAFVTDLNKNLQSVGDATAMKLITQITTDASIQSPFINDIAKAAGAAYYLNTNKNAIAQRLKYTLNTVSANDKAFAKGNFAQGGFNAWAAMTQNPANNPFGANFIVGEELSKQLANETNNRLKELDFGKGFLSFRGACAVQASPGAQSNGTDPVPISSDLAGAPDPSVVPGTGVPTSLDSSDKCLSYKIQTPGSVVEDVFASQLGDPVRQLELANSINQIIGAAITQLVSSALGASGLLGAGSPSSGGGSSALANASNPNVYSGSSLGVVQGFGDQLSAELSQVQTYQKNWQKVLDAANKAQANLTTLGCTAELASIVTPAQTTAAQKASNGLSVVSALTSLQKQMAAEQAASAATQADQLSAITDQYQKLLQDPATPTDNRGDFADATAQAADSGTAVPPSLFTQMTQLAATTTCPT